MNIVYRYARLAADAGKTRRTLFAAIALISAASLLWASIARAQVRTLVLPFPADAVADSFGVNTHFLYTDTPYGVYQAQEIKALRELGVRHIRDGGANPRPEFAAVLAELCRDGIRHSVGFPLNTTPDMIRQTLTAYGPACVDEVEPQNEVDHPNTNPTWATDIVNEQKVLYSTVKSDPQFAAITVLGPPLVRNADYAEIPTAIQYADAGDLHDGTCDGDPLTHAYKNIVQTFDQLKAAWGPKPIWVTETSYSDRMGASRCELPDSVIAKYVIRTQFERLKLGSPKIYWYEFSDDSATKNFGSEGFVTMTVGIKPQYRAVQSTIRLLADPGPAFHPAPISMGMDGNMNNVRTLLAEKRDGTYALFLWLNVPSWDTSQKTLTHAPAQGVHVLIPPDMHFVSEYHNQENGSISLSSSPATGTVDVDDGMTVLLFHK